MPIDKEVNSLAMSLFHTHGDGALAYALRNARMADSSGSELNVVWMRVAKKIESLMSAAAHDRRHSSR